MLPDEPRRPHVSGLLLIALGILLLQPPVVYSQEAPGTDTTSVTLEEALRENSHPLRVRNGSLRGRGGEWLRRQAEDATIITLGEVHGTQEIPAIMGALLNDLQTTWEVDHLAIEVSPWTADLMTDSLRRGNDKYTAFIEDRPATIPFYSLHPERDLIRISSAKATPGVPSGASTRFLRLPRTWRWTGLPSLPPTLTPAGPWRRSAPSPTL